MADTKARKITYATFIKKLWGEDVHENYLELEELIKFIGRKKKFDRQLNLKDSKFCFLDTFHVDKSIGVLSGFISSARHKFRPNLLDQKTGEERVSPKKISEGEKEKTHFAVKFSRDETFLVLEQNGNGVSVIQIVSYLNSFLKEYLKSKGLKRNFSIEFLKVGRDNFLQILTDMQQVKSTDIFLDKSILGSKFLNFSNRTFPIKNEIVLTASAEYSESMKEAAIDIFNISNSTNSISRVRIRGIDNRGSDVTLDTTFIEKMDNLRVNLNATTGEIETTEILTALKGLAKPLE